jgi:2-methylisocitrate lyase-like PEP mutase family enzyme
MNKIIQFKDLHNGSEPLLIGNVWNVQSALVFERLNFSAIATSSAAVAETLGYADGQQMTFDEYFFIINRIQHSTQLPLSVDLEAGYGANAEHVADNIKRLSAIGVVGVNIEDSVMLGEQRVIEDEQKFAALLRAIVKSLRASGIEMFINVRSDVFLLGLEQPLKNALTRINSFISTGVDGLFFPCITQEADIAAVVGASSLPVNVMAMPGLPSIKKLKILGVKRISMGNFLNKKTYQALELQATNILKDNNFDSIFK